MKSYRPALDFRQRLKYRMHDTTLRKHARTSGPTLSGWVSNTGTFRTPGTKHQITLHEFDRDDSLILNDRAVEKLNLETCLDIFNLPKQRNDQGNYTYRDYTLLQIIHCYNPHIPDMIVNILNEACSIPSSIPTFSKVINPRVYAWVRKEESGERVRFKLYIDKFPIQVETDHGIINGFIPGPVEINFDAHERMRYFGTEIHSIDTDNLDILNILKGKKISQNTLLKYCAPTQAIVLNDELSNSLRELSDALDTIGCNHPLSEKARDILVHAEKLTLKTSDATLIKILKATTAMITENKDLAVRVNEYQTALNSMKKSATNNILRGLGYSLLTLAMCLLVVTIPFLFIPFNLSKEFQKKVTVNPASSKHGFAALSFSLFSSAVKSSSLNKEGANLLTACQVRPN